MISGEIVLVDLSSISHPIWHISQSEPDANHTSQQIVARVRALAGNHPHVAICCDSGRSFRHEIAATYKANRPESLAPLQHQIDLARKRLVADGFPVWAVRGFEADDLIATGVARALEVDGATVLIVSADKDLLQLVGERVKAKSVRDGSILGIDEVVAKFGVRPEQMRDYLTLVGDKSDNVKGATGIGEKKAATILAKFGTLDAVYEALDKSFGVSIGLPTSVEMSLREFRTVMPTTRALITLRTDVEIPFEAISAERVPVEAQTFGMDEEDEMETTETPAVPVEDPAVTAVAPQSAAGIPSVPNGGDSGHAPSLALAVREGEVLPAPKEWERGLDPRSQREAITLAKHMYESAMFNAYGSPQAVLATIMVGRELGLPAMGSLRSIYNIEGKHALAASLMVALVLKSGLAEYFEPVSFSDTEATYETKRKGARNPVRLAHTFEMARTAWPKSKAADWEKAFMASGWGRNPTDMLVARASSRLARMIYPDLLAGLYTPEELQEVRESLAA